ncbi:MAG TPA: metallophosphoesterase [Candidatus Bathyarchaeia archaeon]|nr:metallophosphoesterase [Candidatus Bathyarchaeia archaeon]
MERVRLLFATDLHGSKKGFLKFLKALKLYKVNIGIVGGDLTGKLIIPVTKQGDVSVAEFNGRRYSAASEADLKQVVTMIEDSGYYPFLASHEDVERMASDSQFNESVFKRLAAERLSEWTELVKPRLEGTGIKVYVTGGNDDYLEMDDVLTASDSMIFAESKVEIIEGGHEMISTGYSNITPWKCPRDIAEDELYSRIEDMAKKVTDLKSAIFNIHPPPADTALDRCTKLDTSFDPPRPLIGQEASGGSTAVRKAIETFQPLASLHGHIHESRGVDRLGRTLCFNPGSEYTEGVLRGVVLNLSKEKVDSYQFLSG